MPQSKASMTHQSSGQWPKGRPRRTGRLTTRHAHNIGSNVTNGPRGSIKKKCVEYPGHLFGGLNPRKCPKTSHNPPPPASPQTTSANITASLGWAAESRGNNSLREAGPENGAGLGKPGGLSPVCPAGEPSA